MASGSPPASSILRRWTSCSAFRIAASASTYCSFRDFAAIELDLQRQDLLFERSIVCLGNASSPKATKRRRRDCQ